MTETDRSALERAARDALAAIADPAGGGDIVATGRVEGVFAEAGAVRVTLRARKEEAEAAELLARDAESALARLPGISEARVVLTAHRDAPGPGPGPAPAARPAKPRLLGQVRHVVAVASGKGGVGKSTVAVNLAVALARRGLSVGLLDADVHGPSLPRMLGVERRPEVRGDRIQPVAAWGLSCISIGMMVDERRAMIWRGPMVMGALEQLMGQVDWPALDVMIVDMPPGTGDAQLTLAQRVSLAGAVIVSTPQDIALIDARRGVEMFARTGVKLLGMVENMSVFCCPNCGHRAALFGEGGARAEAAALGVPFLGAVPLLLDIRAAGDAGRPVADAAPESDAGLAFGAIAGGVARALSLA